MRKDKNIVTLQGQYDSQPYPGLYRRKTQCSTEEIQARQCSLGTEVTDPFSKPQTYTS